MQSQQKLKESKNIHAYAYFKNGTKEKQGEKVEKFSIKNIGMV